MTIAEWLEEKGRTEGIALGIKQGLEVGEAKSRQAIARRMLDDGMESAVISRLTGLTAEELATLSH